MSQANFFLDSLKEEDQDFVSAEACGGQGGVVKGCGGRSKATCKKGPSPVSDYLLYLLTSTLVSSF